MINLKIKNFGKLDNAVIQVGRFTILAGPNNTGKSFVSKVLYSLFDAMNADHALVQFRNMIRPLRRSLDILHFNTRRRLSSHRPSEDGSEISSFSILGNNVRKMESLMKQYSADNLERFDFLPGLLDIVDEMQRNLNAERVEKEIHEKFPNLYDPQEREYKDHISDPIKDLKNNLDKLAYDIKETDLRGFIVSGIAYKIHENLIHNFQIPTLSEFSNQQSVKSEVNIENVGRFEFSDEDFHFDISSAGIQELQEYSRVIYLESPIYWKLKDALQSVRNSPRFFSSSRERLAGVPKYFYDLAEALTEEYTGVPAFPDVLADLTGSTLGGKIVPSESGDLSFYEQGRSFPLSVTSVGVINLGILALLIERKILDKGSFLFIDEPEAHLHPEWQVKIVEVLFKLAREGVNVVIATHSVDILKWLEVEVKKTPDSENLIALNQFPQNGDEQSRNFSDRLAAIKQKLTQPFSDLYLEGL